MKKGFWTAIEELGPKHSANGEMSWTTNKSTILMWLSAYGLNPPWALAKDLLLKADKNNPGFPWTVEDLGEDRIRFTSK